MIAKPRFRKPPAASRPRDSAQVLTGASSEKHIRRRRVNLRQLALFCRQLGTMYTAGIPIIDALNTVSKQVPNAYFGVVLRIVAADVARGGTLTWALERHPHVFPPILTKVVAAGEASGNLDDSLERSAAHFEREFDVRAKVRGAMTYPVIVLVLAVLVSIFLVAFVIPNFSSMFEVLGGELPALTRLMLSMGHWARKYAIYLAGLLALLSFFLAKYLATPEGRYRWDALVLRVPLFSRLVLLDGVSRFCRTFAALTTSGVQVVQALALVEQVMGNKVLSQAVADTREAVRRGDRISEPLRRTKAFPEMVPQMIAVGEETGQVAMMLDRLAVYFERDLTYMTDSFSKLIEPIMVLGLAGIVGFIVLSVALPMFRMWTLIGG
jgi:type IV pilus assembly protein PilC